MERTQKHHAPAHGAGPRRMERKDEKEVGAR